jgi:hypothetical protein
MNEFLKNKMNYSVCAQVFCESNQKLCVNCSTAFILQQPEKIQISIHFISFVFDLI